MMRRAEHEGMIAVGGTVPPRVLLVDQLAQHAAQIALRLAALPADELRDDAQALDAIEKLAIEKGRPLDVEDLDDEGWGAASEQKKILELGSLGEGAGGAVTRCMLDGGKTIFALKV